MMIIYFILGAIVAHILFSDIATEQGRKLARRIKGVKE